MSATKITRIIAKNYLCLKDINQELKPFNILVGPNASGKTTFLDVVAFLKTMVYQGLHSAIADRTRSFEDLVWGRKGGRFDLGVEVEIPHEHRVMLGADEAERVLYRIALRLDVQSDLVALAEESLDLLPASGIGGKTIIGRNTGGVLFRDETSTNELTFNLPAQAPGLSNIPADPKRFPVTAWFREYLTQGGIQTLALETKALRNPSLPNLGLRMMPDGSNLPRVVALLAESPQRFQEWIGHLRTTFHDLDTISSELRPEDRSRYLRIRYKNGLDIPSWLASEGTLRVIALTALAYAPEKNAVYLVEEPENGIHPTAIEAVCQSLTSVYEGQVLVASHSPVLLSLADPATILCFQRSPEEGTTITRGDQHPKLRDWRGDPNLSVLFAAGVLGE